MKSSQENVDNIDFILRLLVTDNAAGMLIGRGGGRVRNLRNKSGSWIDFNDPIPDCGERIMTISGTIKNIDRAITQMAIDISSNLKTDMIFLDILVPSSHVGAIMGHKGKIIQETQANTKAHLTVHKDNMPDSSEKRISISGNSSQISKAIFQIMCQLTQNRDDSDIVTIPYYPVPGRCFAREPNSNEIPNLQSSMTSHSSQKSIDYQNYDKRHSYSDHPGILSHHSPRLPPLKHHERRSFSPPYRYRERSPPPRYERDNTPYSDMHFRYTHSYDDSKTSYPEYHSIPHNYYPYNLGSERDYENPLQHHQHTDSYDHYPPHRISPPHYPPHYPPHRVSPPHYPPHRVSPPRIRQISPPPPSRFQRPSNSRVTGPVNREIRRNSSPPHRRNYDNGPNPYPYYPK